MLFAKSKLFPLAIVAIIAASFIYLNQSQIISLEYIQENLQNWKTQSESYRITSLILFFIIYVASVTISLPGASLLTLLAGALFGWLKGFIIVSFASTVGATLAFLITRYILRDWVEKKFPDKYKSINAGINRDGVFYLLSLRLAPVVPFFLVNMLMGLTQMGVLKYFIVSQLGMIPGTIAYVYAGQELGRITSVSGIVSPSLLFAFTLLAIVPWISKLVIRYFENKKLYSAFKKPKNFDYNMIVIGGGAAGLVTSYIASAVKAKVALVEHHKMGGDCLNYGCVPSKAIIKSAKLAHQTKNSSLYGVTASNVSIDFSRVLKRTQNVIAEIEPHDSVERYTKLGVDCFSDPAKIISPFEVQIGQKTYTTKNIVIASGASPFIPEIPGLREIQPLTSESLWNLKELPQRLMILGGGPIGCELAQAFQRLGSQVILVEKNEHLMSRADLDVSEELEAAFLREGIELVLSSEATQFSGRQAKVTTRGQVRTIEFDQVIVALGRRARVSGFGLEDLGINTDSLGFIEHNEFLATRYPNIFVCGDCAGPYQFTHVAAHQAWYAALNGLFQPFKKFKQDLRVIPSVTFTEPEIAHVGITEKQAQESQLDVQVTKYDIADLDRAICDGENKGFVKIITLKKSDQILGATIVGSHSGEYLSEIVFAMKHKMGLNKILSTIHAYPTWAESNKYVAGVWRAKNAPAWAMKWLKMFHDWRRR